MNRMIDLSDWRSRCMVCAQLMHKKNTSKDCDNRDNNNNNNNNNNNKIKPSKPVCCNFNKRHWCGILSNALQKYMITRSVCFLWSGAEASSNLIIAELSRAKQVSGAPWVRNWSNLPIRENLVITWPYTDRPPERPSVRTTGIPMWNNSISMTSQMQLKVILAGNRTATGVL